MAENKDVSPPAEQPNTAARGLLAKRVPLWSLLVAVLVVSLAGLTFALARDIPDFGNAVPNSERVDVLVRMCNHEVDAHDVNPRRAELDLEQELRSRGAKKASVAVERTDCPTQPGR